jgi:hypothetical protein
MGDGSKVDYHALAKFGSDTSDGTLKDYQQGVGGPTAKISKGSIGGGALGTNEAQTFKDWYDQGILAPMGDFGKDAPKGLMALGFGATVMAANYMDGDLSQAKGMNDVYDMFSQPADQGLDADLAKRNKDVTDKTTVPLPKPEKVPPPSSPNVCTKDPTPMEQLQIHNNEYGKYETWRPTDPNAPVEVDVEPLGPGMI